MTQFRIPLGALAVAVLGLPAMAQSRPDLNWGVVVTSNYISKGITQSDNHPALQAYAEASQGVFYGGLWSSTVDLDDDLVEFDLYAGVRPTFGDFDVDISYVRYIYNRSGDCCGEVQLDVAYPMADLGSVGLGFDYDPENDLRWGETALGFSLSSQWLLGGTLATDFGSYGYDENLIAWDAGVTRTLGGFAWVDLRYYDTSIFDAHGVVTIGVDF